MVGTAAERGWVHGHAHGRRRSGGRVLLERRECEGRSVIPDRPATASGSAGVLAGTTAGGMLVNARGTGWVVGRG